jgi:hypothetical protein
LRWLDRIRAGDRAAADELSRHLGGRLVWLARKLLWQGANRRDVNRMDRAICKYLRFARPNHNNLLPTFF